MSPETRALLVRRARRLGRGLPGAQAASRALVLRAVGKPDRVAGEGKPDSEATLPGAPRAGLPACGPAGPPSPCPRLRSHCSQGGRSARPAAAHPGEGRPGLRSGPLMPRVPEAQALSSDPSGEVTGPARMRWPRGHTPSPALRQPPGPGQGRRACPTPLVPAVALPPEKAEGREGPGQLFGTDDGERAVNREGPRGPGKRRLNVDVGLCPAAPPAGGQRRGRGAYRANMGSPRPAAPTPQALLGGGGALHSA